jgi:MFS family permease
MTKLNRRMNRNFLLLWQGQLVSEVGTQLFQVVLILWLKQTTGSATLVGLLMMAYTIPNVLLGPLGGVLADRYSRRMVLVIGDVVRGAALLGMGLVLVVWPPSTTVVVVSLFAYAVLGGAVGAIWQPSGVSLVPDLVPKENLPTANSFIQGSFQLGTVGAQAFAGVLFRILGAPALMVIDGISFLYAALSDALLRVPPTAPRPALSSGRFAALKADVMEGLRHIHSRPGMRVLFYAVAFFQVLTISMLVLFPFYVDEQLHARVQWYGFLLAASGLGVALGYGIGGAAAKLSPATTSRITLSFMGMWSLGIVALAFTTNSWIALGIVGVIGIMNGFIGLRLLTVFQLVLPSEIRGRVFGLIATVAQALMPFGMGLTGFIVDVTHHNMTLVYLLCGGVAAVVTLNVGLRRECREFLAGEETTFPVLLVTESGD